MKYRFLALLAAACLFPAFASAQEDAPANPPFELQAGLSVGDLAARAEYNLTGNGMVGLGARVGAKAGSLGGYDYLHLVVFGDLRLYLGKNLSGFYPYVTAGIDSLAGKATGFGDDFAATRAPVAGGLGYKLVFDPFSIDFFLGGGTLVDLDVPSGGVPISLNSILDFLLDGGVFVGYRF